MSAQIFAEDVQVTRVEHQGDKAWLHLTPDQKYLSIAATEELARDCGATHRRCDCGEIVETARWCHGCAALANAEKRAGMKSRPWTTEKVVYVEHADEYINDPDELELIAEDAGCEVGELELLHCKIDDKPQVDLGQVFEAADLPEWVSEGLNPVVDRLCAGLNKALKVYLPDVWVPCEPGVIATLEEVRS